MSFLLASHVQRFFRNFLRLKIELSNLTADVIMESKKQRAQNFSEQECVLLAHLMGEIVENYGISRYRVLKHKFNDRITSVTKKEIWSVIEKEFNSNATTCVRSKHDLSKKWENLTAKHRAIYSDYLRKRSQTGGVETPKYTLLTEAVMDVIGKESINVTGVVDESFDSTYFQLSKHSDDTTNSVTQYSTSHHSDALENSNHVHIPNETIRHESATTSKSKNTETKCCCHCDQELLELKKKKLRIQIKYYESLFNKEQ